MTHGDALRVLVLGRAPVRSRVAAAIERVGAEVTDCDPALGDCVMYVRLEDVRFDVFVFVDYSDAVTRGALAVAPQRSVVIPLFDQASPLDPAVDGYLFRLPHALGFRTEKEREAVLRAVPESAGIASEVVGESLDDDAAWQRLLTHAVGAGWQWDAFRGEVSKSVSAGR